jgi:DNA-binding NarL/FixJ family response regulator
MSLEVVGREEELGFVRAFVAGQGARPAALVLEGDAGIGKSTLWLAGVEHARARGLRVLLTRPAEPERGLTHAGLGDLFENTLDEILPLLQTPRRHALEGAMLRTETPDGRVDQRALGVAVRDALALLSRREPVLVAVDDVQWLDPSSASALIFALRRLSAHDVRLLLSRRLTDQAQPGLEQALAAERIELLVIAPLSVGALHQLLRNRLGRPFPRQTLLRIHERSGGNPFFALEIARVLDADVDPLEPLPVPATLEQLLRARIADLPIETREALALASALGTPSESLLARAGIPLEILEPAAAAHVIVREERTFRFTHPLLSSVLYQDLGAKRRNVHERIAQSVDDPLLRARHLALSRDEPEADVAAVLDEAVGLAMDRAAFAEAAELAEHATKLTPPNAGDDRRRRALAAARAHQAAGEWTRARTIATDLLADTQSTSWRVEAFVLLSELESVDRAVGFLEDALAEAASRPALQSLIHCRLAWLTRFRAEFDHAGAALALAEQLDNDALRTRARSVQTILGWFRGDREAPEDLAMLAREFPSAVGSDQQVQEGTMAIANTFAPASKRHEARALLEREYEQWRDRDEPRSARALWGLAWVEFWAARWELASDHAARAHDIAIQYGLERPQDHLPIAVVAVHRGELDVAREHSERALELAEAQLGFHPPQHLAVLGLVALWSGDTSNALAWLEKADRQATELEWGEPSMRWWTADYAELLLELGRVDEAAHTVDVWQSDATRVAREWVLASATRCRGIIAAAHGEAAQALDLLATAIAEHEAVDDPFGRARAQLALGAARRRARQKKAAREAIASALESFEAVGASGWAEKARAELVRIGGRRPSGGELTATEQRLAALVAEGGSNKEIAAALFVTPKTVGTQLSRIYAKLGVHSRTELAHLVRVGRTSKE